MGYEDAEKPYAIHDELSGGIEWGMKTSEEAVEALESCLVDHRNYAREDGEWASEVESVCGLLVTHVFDREVHTEDDGSYYHEWGIKPTAEWSRIQQALKELGMYQNGQADYEMVRDKRDELAAELERVKAERDELNRIVNEIWGMFYGQGLSVANWHQNGDLEPMEEFFEQNDWDPESCRAANEKGENDAK